MSGTLPASLSRKWAWSQHRVRLWGQEPNSASASEARNASQPKWRGHSHLFMDTSPRVLGLACPALLSILQASWPADPCTLDGESAQAPTAGTGCLEGRPSPGLRQLW